MPTKLGMIIIVGIVGVMLFAQVVLAVVAGPEGEPEMIFDYNGTIDRISNDDIVLDDSWYKLAAQVVYYNQDNSPAYPSSFKKGVTVEYHLDNLGQVDAMRLAN
jgi:hypothetical protein